MRSHTNTGVPNSAAISTASQPPISRRSRPLIRAVLGNTFWKSVHVIAVHPLGGRHAEKLEGVRKDLLGGARECQTRPRERRVRRDDPAFGVEAVKMTRQFL